MLSKLQSRPLTPSSAPSAQSAPALRKPSLDAVSPSPAQAAKPQNTALRTLQGDNVFEQLKAKPGGNLNLGGGLGGLGGLGDLGGSTGKKDPQRAAVEQALAGNGPVSFVNSDGKTEQVSVEPVPSSDGTGTAYSVHVGDDTFTVTFEEGSQADQAAALTQLIDSYSETPADLRGSLENVVVTPEQDPEGAAARAGDETITFYGDDANLTEDIFHHEIGHLIGEQLEEQGDSIWENIGEIFRGEQSPPIPDGWAEAAASDGNHLNDYTRQAYEKSGVYTEDFAEAWSEYMRAIDEGPKALAAFEKLYPARAEMLEDIYPPPR